ncbi:folylpolyglutamate synthase [Apiospora phragmitis]|uniref:Folylpolyglutamate synthase n=1 Tax=Apiospora phragmitis TaxID=2905665 RepID=A0ABR1V0R9_9PEZI
MARTYESALSLLSSLQSNKAVTSLFSVPILPAPASQSSGKPQDLNALAIPEMLAWLGRAGLSQRDLSQLKCIHVAGTKGKGSVCAFLTSILVNSSAGTAGKVGTYTSPHLVSVRERIMIDGRPLAPDLFARYFFEVWDAFTEAARAELGRKTGLCGDGQEGGERQTPEAELQGPATKPFYFRFLTILAFHAFLREGVRSAVVECGIGGEHDSTNVLPAEAVTASVVAPLGIDHVGMLGRTLPEIAWHKIGVAKAGRRCFTRRLAGDGHDDKAAATMEVLRRRAAERGAELVEVPDEAVEAWGGVRADEVGGLEGDFQKYNQALAVCAAREHLRVLASPEQEDSDKSTAVVDFSSIPEEFAEGLRKARLRGRCETRQEDSITWLIDGAHTAESLREVARWFASKRSTATNTRHVLLFNQQERDAAKLLEGLYSGIQQQSASTLSPAAIFDKAAFTRNELQPRSGDEAERDLSVQNAGAQVFARLSPESQVVVCDNVADVVSEARKSVPTQGYATEKTIVLVTGSLHLVGALLRTLEPDSPL